MNRFVRVVAAPLAALCSLSGLSAFAQTAKPSASPSPAAKKNTPTGKMGKKLPARDPKTGKFMKAGGAAKMSAKPGAKKTPMRDPKTGKFIKASPSPAASPKAK